jgi:DivIVA domain-containing protein
MVESERRRLISSTPHLTAEQVLQQTFPTGFRGYSEADVRAFLKRVSEELVTTRDRETELLDAIDALEEQLRAPRPLDESQLLDALGAETSRLLRSARETADEIRARAEEQAAEAAAAAGAEVEARRGEADEYFQTRTAEAEERAAAIVAEAEQNAAETRAAIEAYSTEQRERADRETEELIEAARQQGREMLDEAKSTRERVLADLFRRRGLLQAQVDELRGGRDNLLDAYRVVKRSFLEATGALAQVEVRAAERASHPTEEESDAAAAELHADVDVETEADASDVSAPGAQGTTDAQDADAGEPADAGLADVDSLFARIRAGQVEATPEPPSQAVDEVGEAVSESSEPPAEVADGPQPAAEPEPEAEAPPPSAVESWRARRAEVVDPLLVSVAKRAKRAAQDDQNALLDAVRRHKGRPTAAQVLAPEPEFLAAWVSVTREAIDDAYRGGRVAIGGEPSAVDDDLAAEMAAMIVLPVRERIGAAIDSGEEGDTGGLVERIGARFREWKNQSLENALADALAMSWSRGVYDAAPDGTVLQWIPLVEGRCADCDDNGLEPTVKGSTFPTGQAHPPAHPGCRCLLAPADVLSGLTTNA